MMKRIMAILLACAMVLPQGMQVTAAEEPKKSVISMSQEIEAVEMPRPYSLKEKKASEDYNGDEFELYMEIEERIKEALLEGTTRALFDDLAVRMDDKRYELGNIYAYSPYLMGVADIQAICYSDDSAHYAGLKFTNLMSVAETKAYFAYVDKELASIENVVAEGKDVETKALILHDYIAKTYEYDVEFIYANNKVKDSYTSGGLLKNRIGVCQAYAYLYMYVLNLFDIPCTTVSSEAMNHMWNLIPIDGKYYHVDITWDDPTPDLLGCVEHTYFLLSDQQIQGLKNPHNDWEDKGIKCSVAYPFHKAYWTSANSAIARNGNTVYMIKDQKIVSQNLATKKESTLYTLSDWRVYGREGATYNASFAGMELVDNFLYFNTDDKIYRLDTSLGKNNLTCIYELSKNTPGYIYGMRIETQEFACMIRENLNVSATVQYYDLGLPFLHGDNGDANSDGVTNLKDYMHMKRYVKKQLARRYMAIDSDLTGDSKVNADDLTVLSKMLCEVQDR